MNELLPCPCCGTRTLRVRGAFEICPVCQWEDDPAQARDPQLAGGANGMSLSAARMHWQTTIKRPS